MADIPMAGEPLPPVVSNVMLLISMLPQYLAMSLSPAILNPIAAPLAAVTFSLELLALVPLIVMLPRWPLFVVSIILMPAPLVEVNTLSFPTTFSVTVAPLLISIVVPVVVSFTLSRVMVAEPFTTMGSVPV